MPFYTIGFFTEWRRYMSTVNLKPNRRLLNFPFFRNTDSLFPYAYEFVESFVREHFEDDKVKAVLEDIKIASEKESSSDSNIRLVRDAKNDCIEDVTHNVRHWIEIDKKVTPMKTLQGLIWEEAYLKERIKGHVYPDVYPVLRLLPVPIYIYSSGSVLAQKLLFGHSVAGDMTKILSGFFDTAMGSKGDTDSYRKICNKINKNPAEVLFLTDVETEARAAHEAGLQVKLVVRDGNSSLSAEAVHDFGVIHSLEEIA